MLVVNSKIIYLNFTEERVFYFGIFRHFFYNFCQCANIKRLKITVLKKKVRIHIFRFTVKVISINLSVFLTMKNQEYFYKYK